MAASRRNRYSRSTTGLNAIGFFSSATIYTAATTYSAFVTTAATLANNGQMGIFNFPALTVRTTALGAGDRFFVAQILDGDVKKSPIMTYDSTALSFTNPAPTAQVQVRKTVFSAPVLQSTALGYNGTSGDLGIPATAPTSPVTYNVSARDTSPSTQPFPVQSGTILHRVAASKITTAAAIASDMVNAVDLERSADINFVTVDLRHNGTVTNLITRTATFINGSNIVTFDAAHGLVASTAAVLRIVDTNFSYIVTAITATTMTIDRPYQGASFTTAASGTSFVTVANLGTVTLVGLYITSIVEDTTFVLSHNLPVTIPPTVVTAWRQGSGASWQMADMERDTAVLSGYTNANAPFIEDMGKPTFFVNEVGVLNYNSYFIRFRNVTESMAFANELASSFGYIIIGAPNSGNTPDATISTVLTGA